MKPYSVVLCHSSRSLPGDSPSRPQNDKTSVEEKTDVIHGRRGRRCCLWGGAEQQLLTKLSLNGVRSVETNQPEAGSVEGTDALAGGRRRLWIKNPILEKVLV